MSFVRIFCKIFGTNLTFKQVFEVMENDPLTFHNYLKDEVLKTGYKAVYLEFPKLNTKNLNNKFECVILEAIELINSNPNPQAFGISCSDLVICTRNKSKDAELIIPNLNSSNNYAHLFLFLDPENCQPPENNLYYYFWKSAAIVIKEQINCNKNIWISTSGLGIPWLHLRISEIPKYYRFQKYCK